MTKCPSKSSFQCKYAVNFVENGSAVSVGVCLSVSVCFFFIFSFLAVLFVSVVAVLSVGQYISICTILGDEWRERGSIGPLLVEAGSGVEKRFFYFLGFDDSV